MDDQWAYPCPQPSLLHGNGCHENGLTVFLQCGLKRHCIAHVMGSGCIPTCEHELRVYWLL